MPRDWLLEAIGDHDDCATDAARGRWCLIAVGASSREPPRAPPSHDRRGDRSLRGRELARQGTRNTRRMLQKDLPSWTKRTSAHDV